MARINIEEKLFKDKRFFKLVAMCEGDRDRALGMLVFLWTEAQEHWKKDCSLIPKERWQTEDFDMALVEAGFAVEKEHGFYAKGAEENFSWLLKRVKAGRRGGQNKALRHAPAKQNKKSKKSSETRDSEQPLLSDSSSLGASKAKQTLASYSFSSSYSNKEKEITNVISEEPSSSTQSSKGSKLGQETRRVVSFYCELWKYKHGRSPAVKGKDVGLLKGLVKDLGANRVAELLKGFFQIPDSYYVFKGYSVGVFYANIERIDAYLATGRNVTRTKARQVDEEVESQQQILDWKPTRQLEQ